MKNDKQQEHINSDIQKEQLEIKSSCCAMCNKEFKYLSDSLCDHCYSIKDKEQEGLWLILKVISKLIYGHVSKSDLQILYEIIFELAEQDTHKTFEINQTKLAQEYGFKQSNVSRSIKKLLDSRLLIKNEETGLFQLNFKNI